MEDSSVVDLMDTNEYLIDDWDLDCSLYGEITDHSRDDHQNEIIRDKRQAFELVCDSPAKQIKSNNNNNNNSSSSPSSSSSSQLSSSQVISFGDCKASPAAEALNFSDIVTMEKLRQGLSSKRKESSSGRRQPHLLKEHVIAERKRRQRLNERLIALSALLPDLKKADKATVLEDAIRHLKQLQMRIKQLEEERASTTKTMESVILVKKSHLSVDEDSCSASVTSDEDSEGQICRQSLPSIEARVSNNDLLIRIHCEKSKGCVGKILSTTEKLGLNVVNSFSLPFGNSTLDITILAKMDNNFSRPVKDVVKNIRSAIVE